MIRLNTMIIVLCVLAASAVPVCAAPYMPHCSFLTKSAANAHDVAQLIRQNRVVAQRFANHYGMNNDAIADYIDRNAKVVTVTRNTTLTEYYVDSMGHTHVHQKRVQAGTKILVVQGKPIMDLRCGNPTTKALPSVPAPIPIAKAKPSKQEVAPPPQVQVAEQPPAPPPPAPLAPPPPVVVTPSPPAPVAPVQQVSRRVTPFPWWIVLGGAGFIHGGEGKTPTPPPPPPPPKIPEASALALGAGGMGVVFAALRRFRHK